jgi:calcineurin-like phosphoesterase
MLVNNKEKEVFMIVNQDNSSSTKGIEKAGFRKCASIQTKSWFCFYFDKNIKLF